MYHQENPVEEAAQLTRQLIAIPSENLGKPCEGAVLQYLRARLADWGLTCHSVNAAEERENLVVHFPSPGRPSLVIIGHMDTVSAQGMAGPFDAQVSGGRIRGRGACDDKGPLAAALVTLVDLWQRKLPLAYDITFIASSDEESGMRGSRAMADQLGQFDLCLALEPTCCGVVTAHKGLYRCELHTHGLAAHSSQPHRGRSAIEAMLPIASRLQQYGHDLSAAQDPQLGCSTLTLTQVSGGCAPNIVPPHCSLVVDIRLLPEEDPGQVQQRIQSLCGAAATLRTHLSCRGIRTDSRQPMVQALRGAIAGEGGDPTPISAHYCTDCSQLAHLGPCVVWGPGDIAHAHSAEEYIEISQLEKAIRMLSRFLHA